MANYYKEVKREGEDIYYRVYRTKDDSLVVEGRYNYTAGGFLRAVFFSRENSMRATFKIVNKEADLAIKTLEEYEVLK